MHVVKDIFLTINCSVLLQMYVLLRRLLLNVQISSCSRCQWPRGIRCGSAGVGLFGLWFESHREHLCVSWDCCVLSGRDLSTSWSLVQGSPTDCCRSECDREASIMRRPWHTRGCCATDELHKTDCTNNVISVTQALNDIRLWKLAKYGLCIL
jgi:hypothetical protein